MTKMTEKQKVIGKKVWACNELMKRYIPSPTREKYTFDGDVFFYNRNLAWSKEQQRSLTKECSEVVSRKYSPFGTKKAAKAILVLIMGKKSANDLIENFAIVEDRNDPLVNRWRIKVTSRDKKCVQCGNTHNLHAHHISHWAEDPVNRINPENGVTLCAECHSEEHPELENLILARRCE